MKTFIFRSFIGIFFGAFIAVLITQLQVTFGGVEIIDGHLFIKNSLGNMFCGWFFTVSPLYFEINQLTLPQQTMLHFLTIIILYFTLAFTIGWLPFTASIVLVTLFLFILCYIVIWTSFYLYYKYQTQKLNEELNKL